MPPGNRNGFTKSCSFHSVNLPGTKFPFFTVFRCFSGAAPSREDPKGSYPFMVTSDDGRQVPVVQAYAFGKYLGNLKVTFDGAGNVVKSAGNPILLDSRITQGNYSQ